MIIKIILPILLFLLSMSYSFAATINAETCDNTPTHPHVQTAVTAAARGDTVVVPAGSCTWTQKVSATIAIKLQGAGIGLTTITSGLTTCADNDCDFLIEYTPSSPSSDEALTIGFEVTQFTLDGAYKNGAIKLTNGTVATPVTNIKIHGNSFLRSLNKGTLTSGEYQFMKVIAVYGSAYGVIAGNTFTGRPTIAFYGYPKNTSGQSTWQQVTYTPGTKYNMYFENNTVTDDDDVLGNLLFITGYGGRSVLRYNDLNFSTTGYSHTFIDVHGNLSGGGFGGMGTEVYGNKFTSTSNGSTFPFNLSGGTNFYLGNRYIKTTSGTKGAGAIKEEYADSAEDDGALCSSGGKEGILYPTSTSCTTDGQPIHIWRNVFLNNRWDSSGSLVTLDRVSYTTNGLKALVENEQYYNHQSSWSGVGAGCGTARQASCTKDKAFYWETSQSCTANATGTYGANVTTPLSGTLYRCTDTNTWTSVYTPYTYPHPLRAPVCSGGDCTASSCLFEDVQAAVTAASRGGTVTIPAGNCAWSSQLTITKAVTIQGAKVPSNDDTCDGDETCIRAVDPLKCTSKTNCPFIFYYSPSSASADVTWENDSTSNYGFTVRQILFDGGCTDYPTCSAVEPQRYLAGAIRMTNHSINKIKKVRIYDNRFIHSLGITVDMGDSYQFCNTIMTEGTVWGVVHSNVFRGKPLFAFVGANQGYYSGLLSWNNFVFTPGTDENMYFEDNDMHAETVNSSDRSFTKMHVWVASGWGGRYAMRFNNFTQYYNGTHASFDIHGNTAGPANGVMGAEIYANKITHNYPLNGIQLVDHRGGQLMLFYNRVLANVDATASKGQWREEYADTTAPTNFPCTGNTLAFYLYPGTSTCDSAGNPQHVNRSYAFNNRYDATGNGTRRFINIYNELAGLNWNHFRNSDDACTTTSCPGSATTGGVGCGATPPVTGPGVTCTSGTAYWVPGAGQTCTSIAHDDTTLIGKNASAPLTGKLYRCFPTNTWSESAYYTPLKYPHPLRTGTDTTAPRMQDSCAGVGSCITPIREIECTDSSDPYTMDVVIGISTNENATCKYKTTDDTYDNMTLTFSGSGGRTHTATVSGLACNATHTYHVQCQDTAAIPNKTTTAEHIVIPIADKEDVTPPVLTNLTSATQACSSSQFIKVSTDKAGECRYCIDGESGCTSSTIFSSRTAFNSTGGDRVHHETVIFTGCNTNRLVNIKCTSTQLIESANMQIPINTDGVKFMQFR